MMIVFMLTDFENKYKNRSDCSLMILVNTLLQGKGECCLNASGAVGSPDVALTHHHKLQRCSIINTAWTRF